MELQGLRPDLNILLSKIISNDLSSLQDGLINSDNPSEDAKIMLSNIEEVIESMGSNWNLKHDVQGKLASENESISSDSISDFYHNVDQLTDLIRSRLLITSSNLRIGVGTLLNIHQISEIIELKLRAKGFLTYYWGQSLNTKKILSQIENNNPINLLILSCMAVNDEFNCFKELKLLKQSLPDLRIIVGGSAFSIFNSIKNIEKLSNPYKEYFELFQKSSNLEEFIKNEFHVEYSTDFDHLIKMLK